MGKLKRYFFQPRNTLWQGVSDAQGRYPQQFRRGLGGSSATSTDSLPELRDILQRTFESSRN